MFGVIAEFDDSSKEWTINIGATNKRREEIRNERKEKSLSFSLLTRQLLSKNSVIQ